MGADVRIAENGQNLLAMRNTKTHGQDREIKPD